MSIKDRLINNFEFCYGCQKHLFFHVNNTDDFLNKFLYKNCNKKILIMAFRLYPKILEYINFNYYEKTLEIVSKIKMPITNNFFDNSHIFEIYFNQNNLNYDSYLHCSHCNKYYCPLHVKIAPFKLFDCKCGKKVEICNFCYYVYTNKNIICETLHKI
jgi:hypothetical protein